MNCDSAAFLVSSIRTLTSPHGTAHSAAKVAMSVRKEVVLSSQIEGTQASLVDVLEYQADAAR